MILSFYKCHMRIYNIDEISYIIYNQISKYI